MLTAVYFLSLGPFNGCSLGFLPPPLILLSDFNKPFQSIDIHVVELLVDNSAVWKSNATVSSSRI